MWEIKCWGRVEHLFHSEHAAVSLLEIKKGGYTSIHYHRQRVNQFTVISGRVIIEHWTLGKMDLGKRELGPGESMEVDAGIEHRFCVVESGEMVEVYWPAYVGAKVSIDDIERIDVGGMFNGEVLDGE